MDDDYDYVIIATKKTKNKQTKHFGYEIYSDKWI